MVASAARMKAGPAAALQEIGVDVGRVDEEVRPIAVAPGRLVQFGQVALQLGLGVAPGKVGVALAEAELAQARHHRRAGEGLGEEDHLGMALTHIGN